MNGYSSYNRGMGAGAGLGGAFLGFVGGMVVWAMFGDRIKQRLNENKAYQEMKAQIMDKASSMKDMTESRYNQLVDEVSGMYAKTKGIQQNELNDLVSDLKIHWARIKDRWNEPPRNNTTGTPGVGTGTKIAGSEPSIDDGYNFRS
jgi:hypothetical protein